MAGTPVIAEATAPGTHPYSLIVGGLDVLKQPGGSGFGVPIETIEVVEAGPGSVSSMRFVIDDPFQSISVPRPADVVFISNATGYVYFRGWTDRATPTVDFGGQGRSWDVECSGLEILLDWAVVPPGYVPVVFGPDGSLLSINQQIASMLNLYVPQLHAPSGPPFFTDPNYTRNGSFAFPIGTMKRLDASPYPFRLGVSGIAVQGGTVRQVVYDLLQDGSWSDVTANAQLTFGVKALYTVDFYYNFRAWENAAGLQPDDYTTLTISDTYAGPNRAAGLNVQVDWSGVIRSVYVAGFDATSSGTFSDGSGLPGQAALISDTTIATFAAAQQRAAGVIFASAPSGRGSFSLEDWTATETIHAGSLVNITDAATGLATEYRITQIGKTFQGNGDQTWLVTFGDLPPASAAKEIKRLVHPLRGRAA